MGADGHSEISQGAVLDFKDPAVHEDLATALGASDVRDLGAHVLLDDEEHGVVGGGEVEGGSEAGEGCEPAIYGCGWGEPGDCYYSLG